uniref:SH2 domain-containing protein n=1 Tax=Takifugu rubripes TaxID=31033 RepID=A0A674PME6_TAKRU
MPLRLHCCAQGAATNLQRLFVSPPNLCPESKQPPDPERFQTFLQLQAGNNSASEIRNKHWYGGACDRKTADEPSLPQDGAFMVRKSSGQDAQQPYTLVVFYNGRVYNIPVRFIAATQQYALGREKSGEEVGAQRTPLVLIDGQNNTKDTTRLSYPVRPHGWNADE